MGAGQAKDESVLLGGECVHSTGVRGTRVHPRDGEAGRAVTQRAWWTLMRFSDFNLSAVGRSMFRNWETH